MLSLCAGHGRQGIREIGGRHPKHRRPPALTVSSFPWRASTERCARPRRKAMPKPRNRALRCAASLSAAKSFRQGSRQARLAERPTGAGSPRCSHDPALSERCRACPEPVPRVPSVPATTPSSQAWAKRQFRFRLIAWRTKCALENCWPLSGKAEPISPTRPRRESLLPSREKGANWTGCRSKRRPRRCTSACQDGRRLALRARSAEPVAWQGRWYLVRVEETRPTRIPAYGASASLRRALEAQARSYRRARRPPDRQRQDSGVRRHRTGRRKHVHSQRRRTGHFAKASPGRRLSGCWHRPPAGVRRPRRRCGGARRPASYGHRRAELAWTC